MASGALSRIVIIGGVAGGATAAARISRLNRAIQVTMIERSPDVSFANCGLPYYIGGEIKDRSRLSLQTADSLERALGIKVLTNTEATKINRDSKKVITKLVNGQEHHFEYDKLILSPGASPIIPPMPGINDKRIFTLRNLQDMDRIHSLVSKDQCKRVVVIGAGFIGLELVEQLVHIGKQVTLVERGPTILPQADEEISKLVHPTIIRKGVQLCTGDGLDSITPSDRSIAVKLSSGTTIEADAVVLAMGVRPESNLAKDANLTVTQRGYIPVNGYMQTNDESIYAVGDACETADLVFPHLRATVALGNLANMQGRIAADHSVLGRSLPYRGSLGTSIVRVFDDIVALTGWNEKRLKAASIPYQTVTITDHNHAGYYPGSVPITVKLTFDPETGRVFGAQAIGTDGVDKRIDVFATAIQAGMTVEDLSQTQLCYAPPFGSARDAVTTASLAARNMREKLFVPSYSLINTGGRQVVDVRDPALVELHPIEGAINVPLSSLPEKLSSLDKSKPLMTVCSLGKSSYFASRILTQNGFDVASLIGGLKIHGPQPNLVVPSTTPTISSSSSKSSSSYSPSNERLVEVDCSGLSCPGPLLKLRSESDKTKPGDIIQVTATDPGFIGDLPAFANSNGFEVLSLDSNRGVITGRIRKASVSSNSTSNSNQLDTRKGATVVVFSQEMDKVLGSLVIANGAAAMGGKVTMFFTFWGLNALRHPNRSSPHPKTLMERMFGAMMPRGLSKLPISNMNFGGIGSLLLQREMSTKNLPNCFSLLEDARKQGIRIVACTMSMTAMGIHKEELIDGIEFGGVADYLAAAEKSGTNLFV